MARGAANQKLEQKRGQEEVLRVVNMTGNVKELNYDYANFKAEYVDEVRVAKVSNETLNYTDVKEQESVKEMMGQMVDFKKTPRNCTEEERKGIGDVTDDLLFLLFNILKLITFKNI